MPHPPPLRILLVDDDAATRRIIGRVLARDFQCAIDEAADGLEALRILETSHFSLLVLDQQMPVMDGLETLEAVRASAQHADVPVVMLTSEASERVVKLAVSLGITAYITKPINPSRLSARFGDILDGIRRHEPAEAGHARFRADTPLDPDRPILVVDGDPDFRHFVTSVLAGRAPVIEAETGSQALQLLLKPPHGALPQLVLLGASTGVLGGPLLVRRLRSLPLGEPPLLVGVCPRTHVDEVRQQAVYDAVLARTFIPETFLEQFERLTRPPGSLREFLGARPQFRAEIITATAQVFGMMLSAEVEPVADDGGSLGPPLVQARITLTATEPALRLQCAFESSPETARAIARGMTGTAAGEVTDQDVGSAVGEVTNIIAGRLQRRLAEHGITARVDLPAVTLEAPGRTDEADLPFSQWFSLGQGDARFHLALTELPAGA